MFALLVKLWQDNNLVNITLLLQSCISWHGIWKKLKHVFGFWSIFGYSNVAIAIVQWEFGRKTLTPTYLEDKTEVKVY